MSSVSSTTSTTSRISGLASGLDTDTIVTDMMEASQLKLDKVEQQEQLLEWKQTAYKDITTKLYDFQTE